MSKDYLSWSHDELIRRLLLKDAETNRLSDELASMKGDRDFWIRQAEGLETRLSNAIDLCEFDIEHGGYDPDVTKRILELLHGGPPSSYPVSS